MFISNQKSLPKKQENQDEFFSRVLTKESSISNPSFKVYYGGLPANIPFMWESQPGTPKHNKFNDETLPPLTPPPSYFFSNNPNKKPFKKHSRSNLLRILLLKLSLKKSHFLPHSPSSSSSSSSLFFKSDLSIRVPMHSCRSRFSSPISSFDSRGEYEEEGVVGSPSTLCFGIRRMNSGAKRDEGHHGFN